MTVLVLYGTWHVGARIIHRLSELEDLTVVGESRRVDESVRLIAELKPGIVVLDAEMGQGEGMEVLRRTKSLRLSPVIMMTANVPYEQYRRECLREGADYFFQLPAEIDGLLGSVQEFRNRQASAGLLRVKKGEP